MVCPVLLSDSADESQCVTGRYQGSVKHDRTRPVKESHFWNLTGNDRTLVVQRSITFAAASGRPMPVEIGRSAFKERGHVARIA